MECWIAPRDVIPGKPFGEEIISAIENASVMVLVLSGSANVSGFVMREVERAIANRKVVIPFRIQDVKPAKALELFIAGSQWIDAWVPPLEAKVKLLASTIKGLIGLPEVADPHEEAQTLSVPLPIRPLAIAPTDESTKKPSSSTKPVQAEPKSSVPASSPAPPLEMVSDKDMRAIVDGALEEFVIYDSSGNFGDKNSVSIWRQLYATGKAGAIIGVCDILKKPQHDWQLQWKAITLLNYGLRTLEGKQLSSHILEVVRDYAAYGGNNSGYIRAAALKMIAEAPVPPREKWNHLFTVLQTVQPSAAGDIMNQLPQFTPPDERARTAATILDILTYTADYSPVRSGVSALKALNYRQGVTELREMLLASPIDKAVVLAQLLSEWQDKESVPIIRQVIENWRYGSNSDVCSLLASLYKLERSACVDYIGEVLLGALPGVQLYLLQTTLKYGLGSVKEKPLLDAVSELARTTDDPDIKKEAEAFLGNA